MGSVSHTIPVAAVGNRPASRLRYWHGTTRKGRYTSAPVVVELILPTWRRAVGMTGLSPQGPRQEDQRTPPHFETMKIPSR